MKRNRILYLLFSVFFVIGSISDLQARKVLKVLAIGNSFSEDAVEQNLYELARAQGDSLVIGNAYIPGCPIERHWNDAQTEKTEYSYRKIIGGIKTVRKNQNLENIIKDDDWDIITLQQASPLSGRYETYEHLGDLMNYVRKMNGNHFVFAFHMTWTYAQNSTHPGFANYDKNQTTMYESIINTVKRITEEYKIKKLIPSGTAIQNARTAFGDVLCRDGYHLSLTIGRYIAACTWCEFLTGKNVTGDSYYPQTISAEEARIAQEAAHGAIRKPYKITRINR